MQRLAMAAAGLRHKRRAGFLVRTEQALIVRPDIFIALAGPLPDPFQIDDMNAAPVIGDHPGLLQLARTPIICARNSCVRGRSTPTRSCMRSSHLQVRA